MSKKIVILNGSPHEQGHTAALVKAFTDGAESADAQVTEFALEKMNLHCCLGCFKGNSKNENPCVINDDMVKIYPALKTCDVIVFAGPLYYWNVSAQLKIALDRMLALEEGENLLVGSGQGAVLLMTADSDKAQFDEVLAWYTHLCTHMKWHNLGHVLANGDDNAENMGQTEALEDANGMGERAARGLI